MSQESPPRRSSNGTTKVVRGSALFITNLAKMTGIVLAVLEWARPGPAQDSVLVLCGAFVLGAEALERVVLETIDRLFGRGA